MSRSGFLVICFDLQFVWKESKSSNKLSCCEARLSILSQWAGSVIGAAADDCSCRTPHMPYNLTRPCRMRYLSFSIRHSKHSSRDFSPHMLFSHESYEFSCVICRMIVIVGERNCDLSHEIANRWWVGAVSDARDSAFAKYASRRCGEC